MVPTFHSLMEEGPTLKFEFVELFGRKSRMEAEENLYALFIHYDQMDNTTIETFSSYHYTVYVPDNDAMEKA